MQPLRHRPTQQRWLAALLLALWLAQGLALLHGLRHGPAHGVAAAATAEHEAHAAFGHEAGSGACQLFDQLLLAQAGAAPPPVPALLALQEAAPSGPSAAARALPAPGAYEARAPPRG